MSDYFSLYDTTIEIFTPPDAIQLAKARYQECVDNTLAAWKEQNFAVDELIARQDYIAIQNMTDAAILAESIQLAAWNDIGALYGQCECGEFGGVCAKCAAYCRVIAWAALHR